MRDNGMVKNSDLCLIPNTTGIFTFGRAINIET